MWVKRAGYIYVSLIFTLIALIFRIYYVSFSDLNLKVKAVAGGRRTQITLYNSKGVIYDRNLSALAGNQFSYYLVINPREFDKSMTDYICQITDSEKEELSEKLLSENVFVIDSFYEPEKISGVYVFEGTSRYPQTPIAQHIIGYLDNENVVGLSGIEKSFNEELSVFSQQTSLSYSTNAVQGAISGLGYNKIQSEEDTLNGVVLTLDKRLSEAAEAIMKENITNGALIIMDADNGEILSMCSTPGYDAENVHSYIESDTSELVNNAVTNQPVGSVFKIIVTASALLNNMEAFEYDCPGGIEVGGRVFNCQNNKKHDHQTLEDAFSNSCNSYFIALGQLLGYEKIIETAQLFGVDSSIMLCKELYSSGGKLPVENGILSVANLSIGQGELMLSPLTVSRMTAAVCNGGYLVNPKVYSGMYIDDKITNVSSYSYKAQIFSSEIALKLRKMCIQCVEVGTGRTAMPDTGGAGGKTASAQTGRYNGDNEEILDTYFTGFYPAENPKYVITVFAKNGKSGSETCAPVFREICNFIAENY